MPSEHFQYPRKEKYPMSLFGFVGLLLVLIILIVSLLFIKSSYFSVGTIVIEGNKYVSVEEVRRIANIPESVNIFSLNTATIKTRLMHDLRIAETEVSRRFPGTIVITIKERKPIAYIGGNYGFLEIDGQGVVLAVYKNIKQVNVPMITGIRLDNQYVGDTVENVKVKKIVQYLSMLGEVTLNQFSEVNVKSSDEIVAYTTNSMYIRLGNSERLPDKANLTNEIISELGNKKIQAEYVDLNFSSPVIKFKQ